MRMILPLAFIDWYYRVFFSGLRRAFDGLLGWYPWPLSYLFLMALAVLLSMFIYRLKSEKLGHGVVFMVRMSLWSWALFLALWGFNYGLPTLQQRLALTIPTIDSTLMFNRLEQTVANLTRVRAALSTDTLAFDPSPSMLANAEDDVRRHLRDFLLEHGYCASGAPRVKPVWPGLLLRWGVSGIYNPFVAEGQYDGGLPPLMQPFTLAHEMSHAYGVAPESDCNFLAWVACSRSNQPYLQYAALLEEWIYLYAEAKQLNRTRAKNIRSRLPKGVLADFKSINQTYSLYPEWFEGFGNVVNNAYLKTQGIKDGTHNYAYFTRLLFAWELRH
jgi:hypothetical protein